MPIVTKFVCDRCAASQDDGEQMWDVGITFRHNGGTRYMGSHDVRHKCLWCRKCCEEVGLLGPYIIRPEMTETPEPTIEDMIRAIVRNEKESSE